jgi:hypothetical protein
MRFKKRESNINLLTRQLEQVVTEDTSPTKLERSYMASPMPIKGGSLRYTNDNEVKVHEAKETPVKTSIRRRGPKKDALIDTSKLLT